MSLPRRIIRSNQNNRKETKNIVMKVKGVVFKERVVYDIKYW